MAKLTVIEMVQDILSDMNSDNVNSITDTIESMQVAAIIKSVYFEMMANKNWPHLNKMIQLESSTTVTKPTHMKLPVLVKELSMVNYNKIKAGETKNNYSNVKYLHPDEFIRYTNSRNSDNADVDIVEDFSGVSFLIKNNKAPEYYTSFDDEYLVFDSYNKEVEATLQTSKTQCLANVEPVFTLSDGFIPDLPSEAFPALLAEAKSASFARVKEVVDTKSEQQSQRQRNWLSRKAWKAAGGIRFPDWGRRSKK